LIAHLNRIVFDFDSMRNVKLNDRFEFPNVLNLYDYMTPNVMQDIKKPAEEVPQDEEMESKNEDAKQQD